MPTTLYLYETLQRLLEYAELDANFKNLRTTADAAATKAGTALTSGVTLGNTAQAGATVLDWYEEGTFTPKLLFGGASAGMTFSSCVGVYTRIGNIVSFSIKLILTSKGTSTGAATLTIPMAPYGNNCPAVLWVMNVSSGGTVQGYLGPASIFLQQITPAGTVSNLNDVNFANTSRVYANATFQV